MVAAGMKCTSYQLLLREQWEQLGAGGTASSNTTPRVPYYRSLKNRDE